jgi:hypothetical protein
MSSTRAAFFAITFGSLALAGCSGGIKFNGEDNSDRIQPRTTPINHFPLPLEVYDPLTNKYNIERATLLFGRTVATPKTSQPQYSEPVTDALPVAVNTFVFKQGTDVWDFTTIHDFIPTPIPDGLVDMTTAYGAQGQPYMAGAMSMLCQWLVQNVDGTERTDTPFINDNVEVESIGVTVASPGYSIPAPGILAASSTGDSRQRPIDAKIGVIGTTDPSKTVYTQNAHATNTPTSMPGHSNQIDFTITNAPAALTYGAWRESAQENLFTEDNYNIMVDAPSSGYFNAQKKITMYGGVFIGRFTAPVAPVYDPNIDIAWYYIGVIAAQTFGVGTGLELTSFTRPGVSTEEEDLMNISVATDQVFFVSAGRRFQFTPESLLVMHNTSSLKIGSDTRLNADLLSLNNPFDRSGTRMRETAPGPKR